MPPQPLAHCTPDEGFHDLLRISSRDHREPIRPEESDLIVATFESFAALVRRTGLAPGTVIADSPVNAESARNPGSIWAQRTAEFCQNC